MTKTEAPANLAGGSPLVRGVRPIAWADDKVISGRVGNCASGTAKEYWLRSNQFDRMMAERLTHPLFDLASLAEVLADAERWRKLRDTPATSVAAGPMRGWLFMRPGGAESMDRMADALPGPNVELSR